MRLNLHIGTAGWSIPRGVASRFETVGSHLQRYARVMRGAEINSSFHRSHAPSTYEKWAASTPEDFRFSVKVPRAITHERCLRNVGGLLDDFLEETAGLGHRRGPILVQLAPSMAFDRRVVRTFFSMVRKRYAGPVVCEPRHASWFTPAATTVLLDYKVSRVAADPAVVPDAATPGGWMGMVYFRWHGSPRMYWSPYDTSRLERLADSIREYSEVVPVWCIFDNTATGAALENAFDLYAQLNAAR